MNFLGAIPRFFRSMWDETAKVVWPSRAQTINTTLTVVVTIIAAMIVVGFLDLGLTKLVEWVVVGRLR